MNVKSYLKNCKNKTTHQIVFDGEPLTMKVVWQLRDRYFTGRSGRK